MKEFRTGCLSVIRNEDLPGGIGPAFLSGKAVEAAFRIHRGLPDYKETPLRSLDALAASLGIRKLLVKDESRRFGLNAFKGLGGIYAITQLIARKLDLDPDTVQFSDLLKPEYRDMIRQMVFVTATDGNHGRGVSWAAGLLGCEAHVYMPVGSSEFRAQAIRNVNPRAEVLIMDVGYDDAVRHAAEMARQYGWYLVQDTSFEGYEEIPRWIIQGYTTLAEEACRQMEAQGLVPTHVFLQAGVGSMAGGVAGYLVNRYPDRRLSIAVVEPETIGCIYESARAGDGLPHAAEEQGATIMAGLNCGEPCPIAWEVLRDHAEWYFLCPDYVSAYGMRLLAAPQGDDPKVISGESGAVTTGLTALIAGKPAYKELKEQMGLDESAVVLCISTEGNTDPEHYKKIVYEGKNAMPLL